MGSSVPLCPAGAASHVWHGGTHPHAGGQASGQGVEVRGGSGCGQGPFSSPEAERQSMAGSIRGMSPPAKWPRGCPAGGQLGCAPRALHSRRAGRVQALPSLRLPALFWTGILSQARQGCARAEHEPGACRGWEAAGCSAGGTEPSLVSALGLRGHQNAGCGLVHAGCLQPRPSLAATLGGAAQGQRDAVCGMLSVRCSLHPAPQQHHSSGQGHRGDLQPQSWPQPWPHGLSPITTRRA